jgi:peptidoglycan/LPS O-acetylase OafA/YrhL
MKDSRDQPRWVGAARLILPMDIGAQDIRALDGLRAIAALSVLTFHVYLTGKYEYTTRSLWVGDFFYFLASGVHLFFVLSGFLLFLPYARAILHAQPLPSAKRFYKRRALRILPAYLVCLTLLMLLVPITYSGLLLGGDFFTHVIFIHDAFPPFAQDIEGPLWTLAVEVQFYLALPLLALILAHIVGPARSLGRLTAGIGGIILCALALRTIDGLVMAHLLSWSTVFQTIGQIYVLVTMGTLGKFLEVFAVGMLCAVLYVATVEDKLLTIAQQQLAAWFMLVAAIVLLAILIPFQVYTSTRYAPGTNMGVPGVIVPGLIGFGYATLLLAIVWGHKLIRAPFEFYPLRFIGLISFSLYLWHLPIIAPLIPGLSGHSLLKFRLPLVFLIAYLSYQLVERPFLNRQRKGKRTSARETTAVGLSGQTSLAIPGAGDP